MNLNKVLLIGRLGKKPEVNYIKADLPVARFSLATSDRGYTTQSGVQVPDRTEWHNIVLWRNLAKYAEKYLDKGMLVYIEGKIQTRKWTAQDGTTKYSIDILAEDIKILEKKSQDGIISTKPETDSIQQELQGNNKQQSAVESPLPDIDDIFTIDTNEGDDLPF